MPRTSLFVGDLHPEVDDEDLYEAFRHIGKIVSVKLCPSGDGKAFGYGFVNFERKSDAKKALEQLNLEPLFGRPMQISWLKRGWSEKSERESGIRKLVVDKIAPAGVKPNEVFPRNDDKEGEKPRPNPETNVIVNNFGELLDDDALRRIFEPFGAIKDCCVALDSEGVSKGFGFVEFEGAESAEMAVQRMDGELIPGLKSERRLSVCLAKTMEQGKTQFIEEIAKKGTQKLTEASSKKVYSVFVANFGEALDNCGLYKLFEKFGPISNLHVIWSAKGPKGYGFVEFECEGDAESAIRTMAGTSVPGLPTSVELIVKRGENRWGTPICQIPPAAAGEKNGNSTEISNAPQNPFISYHPHQQPPQNVEELTQKRTQRLDEPSKNVYCVYVANFGEAMDNRGLYKLFEKFGPIFNAVVMKSSKGIGFVEFQRERDAENAIKAMAGTPVPGHPEAIKLIVKRNRKIWGTSFNPIPPDDPSSSTQAFHIDRQRETVSPSRKASQKVGYQLYVANFGRALDDRGLYKLFEKFGSIYNAMVLKDAKGSSKGYGFVEFERERDAENAIRTMAGTPGPGCPVSIKLIVQWSEKQWRSTTVEEGRDHWVEVSGRGFREEFLAKRAHYEVHFRLRFGTRSIREIRVVEDCPDRIQLNFATEALANEAVTSLNYPENQTYPVKIRASRWFPFELNLDELTMKMMAIKIPPQKRNRTNDAKGEEKSQGECQQRASIAEIGKEREAEAIPKPRNWRAHYDWVSSSGDKEVHGKVADRGQFYSPLREKADEQKKSLAISSESNTRKDPKMAGEIRTSSASYKIRSDIRGIMEPKAREMELESMSEDSKNECAFRRKASRLLLAGDNELSEAKREPKKQSVEGLDRFGNKVAEQTIAVL